MRFLCVKKRNYAVQMLFLTPNRNILAGKSGKSERVLAVVGAIVINAKLADICKMSQVF